MQLEARVLFSSILTGNIDIVDQVLSNKRIIALLRQEPKNGQDQTALQMAVFYKQWKIASKLLSHLSEAELKKQDTINLIYTHPLSLQEEKEDKQKTGSLFYTTQGYKKIYALEVHFEIAFKLASNNNIFGEPVSYEPASPNGPVLFKHLNQTSLSTFAYIQAGSRVLPVSLDHQDLSAASALTQLRQNMI